MRTNQTMMMMKMRTNYRTTYSLIICILYQYNNKTGIHSRSIWVIIVAQMAGPYMGWTTFSSFLVAHVSFPRSLSPG